MTLSKSNRKKDRTFGLIAGTICLGITAYQYLFLHLLYSWVLAVGILFIAMALFIPMMAYPVRAIMEYAGHLLGIANTYILLTVLYLILFVPLNLIFRLTGKDTLKLKRDKQLKSYWMDPKQGESSMKNQY